LGLKLYYGGFGDYSEFTVAEDEQSAIGKIGDKLCAPFLPIKVSEITSVDGYDILPTEKCAAQNPAVFTVKNEQETKPERTEETAGEKDAPILRHCKKCDFVTESQGELMRHYATMHPKGG
jgi:hypothetical protein